MIQKKENLIRLDLYTPKCMRVTSNTWKSIQDYSLKDFVPKEKTLQ